MSDGDSSASTRLSLEQARFSAFREVGTGSSLSAISASICLSAKEVAIAEVCRAWLHQRADELFIDDQLETRGGFGSAYLWCKVIFSVFGKNAQIGLQRCCLAPPL